MIKRSAAGARQPEMPFPALLPAPGAIIIMRIEDYRASPELSHPGPAPAKGGLKATLAAWLRGDGARGQYSAKLNVNSNGAVTAVTTRQIDEARIFPRRPGQAARSRLTVIGTHLASLGWKPSRICAGAGRTRVYTPPAGWLA